uniref:Secreted protein n=1 Tax=Mesocestoides corti TaxID=53468 RepID=A0A5K3FXA3_MESCO
MNVLLLFWIMPCVLAQLQKPKLVNSSLEEINVVWGGVIDLFCEHIRKNEEGTCIEPSNSDAMAKLRSLHTIGINLFNKGCNNASAGNENKLDETLNSILSTINSTCRTGSAVLDADTCKLQNSFLSKPSFKLLVKSLFILLPDSCSLIANYSENYKIIKDWVMTMNWDVSIQNLSSVNINAVPDQNLAANSSTIFLSNYLEYPAAVSVRTNATFYSTTMEPLTAFAPIIRSSRFIRFLQNFEETLAEVTSNILKQRTADVIFVYDSEESELTCVLYLKAYLVVMWPFFMYAL